jgi:hypothetical protein
MKGIAEMPNAKLVATTATAALQVLWSEGFLRNGGRLQTSRKIFPQDAIILLMQN